MNRQLSKGTYNTLWLPFDMSGEEVATNFGEGTEVYRLEDIVSNDDGKYVINVNEDTQNGINAFEPIFIKLGEDAEDNSTIQINGYVQVNEDINEKDPVIELPNGWKMVGTKNYGYVPAEAIYLKDNYYYTAGANKTIIRAYRAYFVAPENTNDNFGSPKDVVYNVKRNGLEDNTTTLRHATKTDNKNDVVYDLYGRKLDASESLPKGIYIRNGKKYIRM